MNKSSRDDAIPQQYIGENAVNRCKAFIPIFICAVTFSACGGSVTNGTVTQAAEQNTALTLSSNEPEQVTDKDAGSKFPDSTWNAVNQEMNDTEYYGGEWGEDGLLDKAITGQEYLRIQGKYVTEPMEFEWIPLAYNTFTFTLFAGCFTAFHQ